MLWWLLGGVVLVGLVLAYFVGVFDPVATRVVQLPPFRCAVLFKKNAAPSTIPALLGAVGPVASVFKRQRAIGQRSVSARVADFWHRLRIAGIYFVDPNGANAATFDMYVGFVLKSDADLAALDKDIAASGKDIRIVTLAGGTAVVATLRHRSALTPMVLGPMRAYPAIAQFCSAQQLPPFTGPCIEFYDETGVDLTDETKDAAGGHASGAKLGDIHYVALTKSPEIERPAQ